MTRFKFAIVAFASLIGLAIVPMRSDGQDITTTLVLFLNNLAAGQIAVGTGNDVLLQRDAANVLALKNTSNAQTIRIYNTTTGPAYAALKANGDGQMSLSGSASSTQILGFGGATSSFTALRGNATKVEVVLADNSAFAAFGAKTYDLSGNPIILATTPTISSGFGTSPSVTTSSNSNAFLVNVGTGGVATSGVIGVPNATNGWSCAVTDRTTNVGTRQTASTISSITVTAASAWTASDILQFTCLAY